MKVIILFGAGASAFSGLCYPKCPPLGDELFSELQKDGVPASELDEEFTEIFSSDGFENGMDVASKLGSNFIVPLQQQIALYFSKFEIIKGNHYDSLISRLGDKAKEICFSSLNYDVLLEQAISLNDLSFNCNPSANSDNNVQVLKLHGSSNFLPQLPSYLKINDNEYGATGTFVNGLPTHVAVNHNEVLEWCQNPDNGNIPPVMSLYAKGKNCLVNSSCIQQIQNNWRELALNAKLVILVGVKFIEDDEHIWNPIKETKARIAAVDPNKDQLKSWLQKNGSEDLIDYGRDFGSSIENIINGIETTLQIE